MDLIRQDVAGKLGAGFVDPVFTGGREHEQGDRGPLTATARSRGELDWTTVVEDAAGSVVRTMSGFAAAGEPVTLAWDLADEGGRAVRAGVYVLRLTGSSNGDRALPYEVRVTVRGQVCRGNALQRARCRPVKRPG
jgi:hypothetical protein